MSFSRKFVPKNKKNFFFGSKMGDWFIHRIGFLVSKESVVLRWWESENKNLVSLNKLIKVELPLWEVKKPFTVAVKLYQLIW